MTRISEVKLIKQTVSTDDIGQLVASESTKTLIAEIKNASQSEYMQGKQDGISPAFVFHVSIFGYDGETILEHKGERFSIYRTYQADENYIELYAEREVGPGTAPEAGGNNV